VEVARAHNINLSQSASDALTLVPADVAPVCNLSTPQRQPKLTCRQKRDQESIWLTSTACHSMVLIKFIAKKNEKAEEYRIRRSKEREVLVFGYDPDEELQKLQKLSPISTSITPTIASSATSTATTPSIAYSTDSCNQHHPLLPAGNGISSTRPRALSDWSEELHGIISATGTITLQSSPYFMMCQHTTNYYDNYGCSSLVEKR